MRDIKGEKRDRRIVKTKRSIRNAFIKLLSEKDFNEITIKDIADEADVDRKTLYNHYSGIYEIREELENDLAELLEKSVTELDFETNLQNPLHLFEIMTDILNTNLDLCGYLMKINAHSHIVHKIDNVLKNKVEEAMQRCNVLADPKNIRLCTDFVTSGVLTVYQNWFNSDRSQPLQEVSYNVGRLVFYGLKDFINPQYLNKLQF